jgi:radical SAM family RiPP maturation amino acid epimerase
MMTSGNHTATDTNFRHAPAVTASDIPPTVFPHVKRFFEWWLGDGRFRDALVENPRQAVAERNLAVDPEELRFLWDEEYRKRHADMDLEQVLAGESVTANAFFAWLRANQKLRDRARLQAEPRNPRFAEWRRRQVGRCSTQFRSAYNDYVPHIPIAIELSQGCSVGCWFCGVDAPKLKSQFLATPENLATFEEILEVIKIHIGAPAAAWGFLYWATDPFDNPDYERFAEIFERIFHRYPATTTAQATRDVARTRRMIGRVEKNPDVKFRFSLPSVGLLYRVFAEFTPEELSSIDLIPLNKSSLLKISSSGRARSRTVHKEPDGRDWLDQTRDQTISCVSGFLINMVERSIALVTPCNSSDKHPLGYITMARDEFSNAGDLDAIIREMMAVHMPLTLPREATARFRDDLSYKSRQDGFQLETEFGRFSIHDNALIGELGDMLRGSGRAVAEIEEHFAGRYGIGPAVTTTWLDGLFRAGLLDELALCESVQA